MSKFLFKACNRGEFTERALCMKEVERIIAQTFSLFSYEVAWDATSGGYPTHSDQCEKRFSEKKAEAEAEEKKAGPFDPWDCSDE